MADTKTSDFPAADLPLAGTEETGIIQGGVNKRVAVSEIGGSALKYAQTSNTDTTTNLNSNGTNISVPITGTTVHLDSDTFTISGNRIQCDFDGVIEVTGSLYLKQGGNSTRLIMTIDKNSAAFGPIVQSTYSRTSSVRASAVLQHIMTVEDGDLIGLFTQKNDGFSTAEMAAAGTSFLTLKRIS